MVNNIIPLGFIYGLQNPNNGEIFYVGATEISLKNRLRTHYQHLNECNRGVRKDNLRYKYLRHLLPKKCKIILLEVVTEGNLFEREKFYISKFRELNPKLVNMTDGGPGGNTSKYFSQDRLKEIAQKVSNANKGKKKPEGFSEHLSKIRKGKNNPASKPIKFCGLVAMKLLKDGYTAHYYFKYGFEVNEFCNSKNAYGNILKSFNMDNYKNPYGYNWQFFEKIPEYIRLSLIKCGGAFVHKY